MSSTSPPQRSRRRTLQNGNNSPIAGGAGFALNFDGGGDGVVFEEINGLNTTAATIMMWSQSLVLHSTHNFFQYTGDPKGDALNLHCFSLFGELFLTAYREDTFNMEMDIFSDTTFFGVNEPGTWNHIALSWDISGYIRLYINGTLVRNEFRADTVGVPLCSNGNLFLGQRSSSYDGEFDPRNAYNGLLDEFRWYPKVLTEAEVRKEMVLGSSESWLIQSFHLSLDATSSTSVRDELSGQEGSLFGKNFTNAPVLSDNYVWSLVEDGDSYYGPTWVPSTAPVVGSAPVVVSMRVGGQSIVRLSGSDPDGDPLRFFVSSLPIVGELFILHDNGTVGDVITEESLPREVLHTEFKLLYQNHNDSDSAALDTDMRPISVIFDSYLDEFSYFVMDPYNASAAANVTILANHLPKAVERTYELDEDVPYWITVPCYDPDGDVVSATLESLPDPSVAKLYDVIDPRVLGFPTERVLLDFFELGEAALENEAFLGDEITSVPYTLRNPGHDVVWVPMLNVGGVSTEIQFKCKDAVGYESATQAAFVSLLPVNDPPVVEPVVFDVDEDTTLLITLNATDVENDPVSTVILTVPLQAGTSVPALNITVGDGVLSIFAQVDGVLQDDGVIIVSPFTKDTMTIFSQSTTGYGAPPGVLDALECFPVYGPCDTALYVSTAPTVVLVDFGVQLFVDKISIYEVYNPGCVERIELLGMQGMQNASEVVYESEPALAEPWTSARASRLFEPPICRPKFSVNSALITFRAPLKAGYGFIDAVSITGASSQSNRIADNDVQFQPKPDFFGTLQFLYAVDDCYDLSAAANVTINIHPINDPPATAGPSDSVPYALQETPWEVALNAVDVDSSNIGITILSLPDFAGQTFRDKERTLLVSAGSNLTLSLSDKHNNNKTFSRSVYFEPYEEILCDQTYEISYIATDGIAFSEMLSATFICPSQVVLEQAIAGVVLDRFWADSSSPMGPDVDVVAAVLMAVTEINNKTDGIRDDLLPYTHLRFESYWVEDFPGPNVSCISSFLGPATSDKWDIFLRKIVGQPLLGSFGATAVDISNEVEYFYRVGSLDDSEAVVLAHAIRTLDVFSYNRLSVLYEYNEQWKKFKDEFVAEIGSESVVLTISLDADDVEHEIREALDDISVAGTNVNVVVGSYSTMHVLMREAHERGMLGQNDYLWFSAHTLRISLLSMQANMNASEAEDISPLRGLYFVDLCDFSGDTCVSGINGDDCQSSFLDRWKRHTFYESAMSADACSGQVDSAGNPVWEWLDPLSSSTVCVTPDFDSEPDIFAFLAYDAVYAMAMALNSTAKPGIEVESAAIASELYQLETELSTGFVDLTAGGERETSTMCYAIRQVVGTSSSDSSSVAKSSVAADPALTIRVDILANATRSASSWKLIASDVSVVYASDDNVKPSAWCDPDYYYDEESKFCQPCQNGLHALEDGMESCTVCGYVECPQDNCGKGQFYNQGSGECQDCAAGTYTNVAGLMECFKCGLGNSTNGETGRSSCLPCENSYSDEVGLAECKSCPDNTGSKDGARSIMECSCKSGYWHPQNATGENCQPCPNGATCAGGTARPRGKKGYWGDVDYPSKFWECSRGEEVCGYDSTCLEGSDGVMCAECADDHFSIGGRCFECPPYPGLSTMGGISFVVLVWIVINKHVAADYDAVDLFLLFIQLQALLSQMNLRWHSITRRYFDMTKLMTFDIDFFTPDCVVEWSRASSIYLQLLVPMFYLTYLLSCNYISGWWRGVPYRPTQDAAIVQQFVSFVDITYVSITMKSLVVFRCFDLADGTSRLLEVPEVLCYSTTHLRLLFAGTFGLLIYSFGFPLLVFGLLYWGLARDRLAELEFYRRFSMLYDRYEAEYLWWHSTLILRRLFFCFILLSEGEPIIQAVLAISVLVVLLGLHAYSRAFIDTTLDYLDASCMCCLLIITLLGIMSHSDVHYDATGTVTLTFLVGSFIGGCLLCLWLVQKEMHIVLATRRMMRRRKLRKATTTVKGKVAELFLGWFDGDRTKITERPPEERQGTPVVVASDAPSRMPMLSLLTGDTRSRGAEFGAGADVELSPNPLGCGSREELQGTNGDGDEVSGAAVASRRAQWWLSKSGPSRLSLSNILGNRDSSPRVNMCDTSGVKVTVSKEVKEVLQSGIFTPAIMRAWITRRQRPRVSDVQLVKSVVQRLREAASDTGPTSRYSIGPEARFYRSLVSSNGPSPAFDWLFVANGEDRQAYARLIEQQLHVFNTEVGLQQKRMYWYRMQRFGWGRMFTEKVAPSIFKWLLMASPEDVAAFDGCLRIVLGPDKTWTRFRQSPTVRYVSEPPMGLLDGGCALKANGSSLNQSNGSPRSGATCDVYEIDGSKACNGGDHSPHTPHSRNRTLDERGGATLSPDSTRPSSPLIPLVPLMPLQPRSPGSLRPGRAASPTHVRPYSGQAWVIHDGLDRRDARDGRSNPAAASRVGGSGIRIAETRTNGLFAGTSVRSPRQVVPQTYPEKRGAPDTNDAAAAAGEHRSPSKQFVVKV